MPSLERDSSRIVIAGASSLLGAELKSLLEEGRFAAWAELDSSANAEQISSGVQDAGFALTKEGEAGPSNVSAAGEKSIQLAKPEADPSLPGTWWFWGAADNIRLPAANAVKLAEMLA
jgi:hypothetical protein